MKCMRDTQNFRGSVQRGQISPPIRTCGWYQDWLVSEVNSVTLDFWGAMASLFPICLPHQGIAELVRPRPSFHDAGSRGQQRKSSALSHRRRTLCLGR